MHHPQPAPAKTTPLGGGHRLGHAIEQPVHQSVPTRRDLDFHRVIGLASAPALKLPGMAQLCSSQKGAISTFIYRCHHDRIVANSTDTGHPERRFRAKKSPGRKRPGP